MSRSFKFPQPILCAIALLLLAAPTALAQKTLSGTLNADTTLDTVGGAVYHVTGAVTVNDPYTLTIDPGVTLKFDPGVYMNVYGTLTAIGGATADSAIVFTSIKDDLAPLAGGEDTNGDGGATTPALGDWNYVQFLSATSSGSVMRYCTVRYGGSGSYAQIYFSSGAAPTLGYCDLDYAYEGLRIRTNSAPVIRNTSLNHMTTVPVAMEITTDPVFDNLILDQPSGNAHDVIQLVAGGTDVSDTLTRPSATLGGVPVHSLAYWVTNTIVIGAGETLDIAPGVVLKFNPNTYISNSGLLTAFGGATEDSLIYFTSIDDDNAPAPLGQDSNTNGNGTFPDQTDWGGVRFFDACDDNSTLRNVNIHFAGYSGASYGAVTCADASPRLVNCDLTSAFYGLKCTGVSLPLLSNSSINAMQDVPVAIEIGSDPVFDNLVFESTSDNGFDAIGILGGTLSGANTLRIRGAQLGAVPIENLVYILLSDITVAVGGSLTVDAGIVAKPRANVDLWVDGALFMDGTADPDSQIVFTSYKDDNYGTPNDTNNDGSITAPAKADWGHIRYRDGSTGSVSHAVLRFGAVTNFGLISAESASPSLSNLDISDTYYGIRQGGTAASAINTVDIANTTYTPVLMSISADPVYSGITFTNVGLRAIGIIPETVGVNSLLRVRSMSGYDNITYYLAGDINVAEGAHFRIEPGIVLKMAQGGYGWDLNISGSLQAVGTPDSLIAFTGILDDSRGNPTDTAGDGANTPAASQWGYVKFNPTSVDVDCNVRHAVFAYGGYGYSTAADAAIWCNSASPTIRDCEFNTNNMGVWTDGNSAPLIQDNDFFNQTSVSLATSVLANPNYVGNTFNQNGIHAVGLINETLSQDATLEKISMAGFASYPYYNLGRTDVGVGTTLTVEPGVLIKARASTNVIGVYGALQSVGTVGDRIILTSIKDDSQGGDSNVDGGATSPAAGNWYGIYFYDSTDDAGSLIQNCLFRFAGTQYVIGMDSASPAIINNEFELCSYGLQLLNESNPVIANNLFRVLTWYAVEKSILAQPIFSSNTLDNVNYHCLGIRGETLGQDMTLQTWDFAGYTNITQALVRGTLTVQLGATLTVEPGVVLKMLYQSYSPFATQINVSGSLVADGTDVDPIIFTSVRDDSVGNPADTNTDGSATAPAKGNWNFIYFDDVSDDATAILDHCELRYGYNGANYGMVYCNSASPTLSNTTLAYAYHGLGAFGTSAPVVDTCVFDNFSSTPVRMSLNSDPVFSGNVFTATNGYNALGIHGETLAQDTLIPSRNVAQVANIPYVLLGDVIAGYSAILRIEPGVVIKGGGANITIRRGFIAEGTADNQIVFTSVTDDFHGGDTNNDGSATSPWTSRWGRIIIQNEAIDDSTRIDHAVFRYGVHSASYGVLDITSANPEIDNSVFSDNGIGVYYRGTAGDPAEGWVHDTDFYDNTYYGVRNDGTAFTVDATNNWWGHSSGPLDNSDDTGSGGFYNPTGLGDPVTDKVDYGTWRTDGIDNILLGDVSRNGDIRAYDTSLVLQNLVAPGLLGPLQLVLGDVNCSGGDPSALDASLILRYVAGLDTYFPCTLDSTATKRAGEFPGDKAITFNLDLPAVTLGDGDNAWVPIHLDGSGDLYGQEYHVRFDPEQVSVTGVRLLPAAEGAMMVWNVVDGNELRIALAVLEPVAVTDAVEFQLTAATGLEAGTQVDLNLSFARLNEDTYSTTTGAGDTPGVDTATLFQNHPNPFNPTTTIGYALPAGDTRVKLAVYDLGGRLVRELVNEVQSEGPHSVMWDGQDGSGRRVGSGIYLYRLQAGDRTVMRKMALLK